MSSKTKNILNWVLAGLVAAIFLGSAFFKLTGAPEAVEGATKFGLTASTFTMIGVIELVSIILFLIPRTGVLGTLLLAAYMGGAIATHLEHGESIVAPVCISAFVWIVAIIRFPELRSRIMG
jgi:hypothetical protein